MPVNYKKMGRDQLIRKMQADNGNRDQFRLDRNCSRHNPIKQFTTVRFILKLSLDALKR